MATDPRVVAHYNFEGGGERLIDRGSAKYDGTIVGSEWNQGRFPGKSALEFKRTGDRVRIDIPGKFDQLTLTSWLRMDALTGRTQAIFLTDGFEEGRAHWQINRDGYLSFGVRLSKPQDVIQADYNSAPLFGSQEIGRWSFLCLVYDREAGVVKHYVNGAEVSREAIVYDQQLSIGPAQIGNWAHKSYSDPVFYVRNFSGRIDELTVWKDALSSREIRETYLKTRP